MQRKQTTSTDKPTAGELLKDPERLLDNYELAIVLNRSRSRIQKDSIEKRGPPFIRVGRLIRYRVADVTAYLQACTVRPAETQAAQSQSAA
jgi:hypothetical protein